MGTYMMKNRIRNAGSAMTTWARFFHVLLQKPSRISLSSSCLEAKEKAVAAINRLAVSFVVGLLYAFLHNFARCFLSFLSNLGVSTLFLRKSETFASLITQSFSTIEKNFVCLLFFLFVLFSSNVKNCNNIVKNPKVLRKNAVNHVKGLKKRTLIYGFKRHLYQNARINIKATHHY